MPLLSSDWLKRMVMKSASDPAARIIHLFTILQDWLDAPGMRDQLMADCLDATGRSPLQAFLKTLAAEAGLTDPDKLAFQFHFLLIGAINEELRNPGSQAMTQAGEAAASLIAAAKPSRFSGPRIYLAASFASLAIVALVAAPLLKPVVSGPQRVPLAAHATLQAQVGQNAMARPDALVAIYQMNNKIKSGQCSYPQALMLAADQRSMFMEGVVNIEQLDATSTNLEEVRQLYQKVTCNYAPAAMLL